MGKLIYGPQAIEFDIEDRTLTHLQLVILAKLRRNESFSFTWVPDRDTGLGRATMWIHPTQYLLFQFAGSRHPAVNRQWIDELMTTANSVGGLRLVPEPSGPGGPAYQIDSTGD